MIILKGKYNEAKVFTDTADDVTTSQIIELCNQEFAKKSIIRIMPDCHKGAGCTIGTTMTLDNKVVPNLVGVDIGCGIYAVKLEEREIDFSALDIIIRENIPSGFKVRAYKEISKANPKLELLFCKDDINLDRAYVSIGTLGGGNHFIEVGKDSKGSLWLLIHSGSRNIGKQVAEYHQGLAVKKLTDKSDLIKQTIERLKQEGREKDIEAEVKKIKMPSVPKGLEYLDKVDFRNYLRDMIIMQEYARINREEIAEVILRKMSLHPVKQSSFHTVHNYIDIVSMILRKGAVSAEKDETLVIPINMRDGTLLCKGKGNSDWNYSAPHGAGRLMSRSQARAKVSLGEFEDSMKDVWTTSVSQSTIDESPMAYKPMSEILENIKDTVEVIDIIKPLYNFKAGE
jgi:RNA-splicing ligase RtcB